MNPIKWQETSVRDRVGRWTDIHFYDTPLEDFIAALRSGAEGLIDAHIDMTSVEDHGDYAVNVRIVGDRPGLADWLVGCIAIDEASALALDCLCIDEEHRPDCPDRILADCEAKRQIIDLWKLCPPADDHALLPVLRLLAAPYADRPGFREEWR